MKDLEQEIKELIIDSLCLEDITPEDINSEEAIFGDGLGLDSIDALELGLAIKKKYKVPLDSSSKDTHQYFASVNALKAFVEPYINPVNS